jgi:hypothetical protein
VVPNDDRESGNASTRSGISGLDATYTKQMNKQKSVIGVLGGSGVYEIDGLTRKQNLSALTPIYTYFFGVSN